MSKESEEIDAAWFAIKHGWDIEPREYFEREAPRNGFKYPLAQAIHHLWKRCVKENPEFLRVGGGGSLLPDAKIRIMSGEGIDYTGFKFAKPISRRTLKAREKRAKRRDTAAVRAYVFAREQHICRCCRLRRADSMHEIRFRSLGGVPSKTNSIALCGDGVNGCHGYIQRHEIDLHRTGDSEEWRGRLTLLPTAFRTGGGMDARPTL